MTLRALSANRLADGAVVYLRADGIWSTRIKEAATAEDDPVAERLAAAGRAAEKNAQVVGAYLIEIVIEGGAVAATTLRERIRAAGPTVIAA